MPEVISFQKAISKTKSRTLLIGNGFSAKHFNYENLFVAANFSEDNSIKKVFETFETKDFEEVVRNLEVAATVLSAYDNDTLADRLKSEARKVRESLVCAIN